MFNKLPSVTNTVSRPNIFLKLGENCHRVFMKDDFHFQPCLEPLRDGGLVPRAAGGDRLVLGLPLEAAGQEGAGGHE